eukprot:CAMPEP_0117036788 /NCGR_PEP_ID=MMETSP0472-20121206/26028_1 /TAXON_ID=693140 ORGANISM="Tiarina fusus, Strain LIS" /NCGR_SAMPLE_ID=MMETSP0472 /ASSEMBLY_ACC=CAM_ASM_000603 /LENGTH=812 /DNA_ID=CAMNT_0004746627 /DNA_START=29 /DNA_END=2467 /DNA_ORIENTATION=-
MRSLRSAYRYQNDGIESNPTQSESDEEEAMYEDEASAVSSESGFALKMQMPTGYLLGDSQKDRSRSPASSPKEEEEGMQRLVLLAKHPNVTDEEVTDALNKQQLKQQQKKQRPPVTFASDSGGDSQSKQPAQMDQAAFAANLAAAREQDFDEVYQSTEEYQGPPKSFFATVAQRIFPTDEASHDVSLASHSVASEPTLKVSNVDEVARRERIRKEVGDLTFGERMRFHCKRLVSTKKGIITLCLLFLLLLAMIVIIAVAVASDRQETSSDEAKTPGTMIPRPVLEGAETPSPTGAPGYLGPMPTPTELAPVPTAVPTESPTLTATRTPTTEETAVVSPAPTFKPTRSPTSVPTATPETGFPTRSPTERPSKGPTPPPTKRPTPFPTRSPTLAPTTLAPTSSPTTSSPTASPTVTFLETPFQPVGDTLVGSQDDQRFGQAIALSADGLVMAVGAPDSAVDGNDQAGMVQVYRWSTDNNNAGEWVPRGDPLVGRNELDQFGTSIALSEDGSVLVASEPTYSGAAGDRSGNVRVFGWTPFNRYEPLGQELGGVAASDHFGVSVALSQDGHRLAVGAPYHDSSGGNRNISGQVTVFEIREDLWEQVGSPMSGFAHLDWFGWIVELSDDGSVVAVGAPRNLLYGGYVNCYRVVGRDWEQLGSTMRNTIEPVRYDDNFGHAIRMFGNDRIAIGAPGKNGGSLDAGQVEVFELDAKNEWRWLGPPITAAQASSGDQFGFAVALRGNILVVGSPGRSRRGQVDFYQYDSSSSEWILHPDSLQGENRSNFGFSLQLTDSLAVGSAVTSGPNTGSVQVFKQS